MAEPEQPSSSAEVRASALLKVRAVWILPMVLASVLIFLMTLTYFGSVVDPISHLHGLPVLVVNEDHGATAGTTPVNIGQQVADALTHSSAVTSRLSLRSVTFAKAEARMNVGADYAAIVIPPTLTVSLLAISGGSTLPSGTPSTPSIELLANQRLGSLGASLATGVAQPALDQISGLVGQRLLQTSTQRNPILRSQLANPITVTVVTYRPLPPHSALGLSAFYLALLTIMCGFLGATIVNTSTDTALGYATSEVGPRWRQRRPLAISRWQTLLAKWLMALVLVPLLVGLLLVVAVGILHMDAPDYGYQWLFSSLAAVMVAFGTLALFAALGGFGQLVALLFFVYLALASSGGTVPLQAVPGVFKFVSQFEPLRQILDGTRAILYFGAQGAAGLTRSLIVIALELVFWIVVGTAVTVWYDRRGLSRLQPEVLEHINQSILAYTQSKQDAAPVIADTGSDH
jgi:YhgE/Pip-like protein